MVCPFCDGKMNRGHIWVGGNGSGVLQWQAGRQIRRGLFGKIADATLLPGGLLVAPTTQAFRCSSCRALLTNFKDPDPR
ncbi:MAG: PF20097 family protein [Pirellulaceae bacterium]